MKKTLGILLLMPLLLLLIAPIQAKAGQVLIIDEYGLFTESEREKLEDKAQKISDDFDTNVVILTSGASLTSNNYARDAIESLGSSRFPEGYIGYAIDMADRSYWVDAYGDREREIFKQSDTDSLSENAYSYLREGEYYDSANSFLNGVNKRFRIATSGFGNLSKLWIEPGATALAVGGGTVLALVVAGIATGIKAGKHRDKTIKVDAGQYGRNFNLSQNRDRLVRTYQTRVKVPEPSHSSGGGFSGGGGSAGHTGSGGHF